MTRRRARRRPKASLRRRALRALLVALAGVVLLGLVATALPVLLLREVAPPTSAFMLRSRIADPASGAACETVDYQWVPRDRIARDLRRAVVLAEDQRFLLHHGFDFRSIERAVTAGIEGDRVRGASTLTQQLAKNLFLWPERSLLRKGLEAWLTFWIERSWSKQRILEVYLNVAQFGPCLYGVEAAARAYFDVSAAELDPEQAALLAAVLPNPSRLRAWNPGPYAQQRAGEILELMDRHASAGFLRGL